MSTKKRSDRRIQRTRGRLGGALVELVKEKRFDDITVQNVIDRADVGRATFYTHFRDKEDLFDQQWQQFNLMLARKIDWDKAGKDSFFPALFVFQHLQEAQSFYRGLVRSRKTDAIFKSGIEYLSRNIESSLNERLKLEATRHQRLKPGIALDQRLKLNPRPVAIPIPILSNYLARELFGLLKWWLDAGMPYPPQSMDKIFHNLVNPTLKSALRIGDGAVARP